MLLREFFPGVLPPQDAGPGGNAGKPRGSGKEWRTQSRWPYSDPSPHPPDEDEDSEMSDRLSARFASFVGLVVPRRDMGYARVDAGNFLGQSGTFNALAEGGVGFMQNSIVPLVHFNRMTNRTQDPNDPVQIPNITSGPGVKNRTGTLYGTSHAAILAGDDDFEFNPGMGDVLPDRDERGLIKANNTLQRFRDLHARNYGSGSTHPRRPVIVGERK
jgi:hypothetical protein